jgi:mRNA interferase RelE/StbE
MSKPWKLVIGRQPQKALRRLPRQVRQRIDEAILGLADDPHPDGCRPVKTAARGAYRVRVGDYRVIYIVLDDEQMVIVARIARRGERTYKGL